MKNTATRGRPCVPKSLRPAADRRYVRAASLAVADRRRDAKWPARAVCVSGPRRRHAGPYAAGTRGPGRDLLRNPGCWTFLRDGAEPCPGPAGSRPRRRHGRLTPLLVVLVVCHGGHRAEARSRAPHLGFATPSRSRHATPPRRFPEGLSEEKAKTLASNPGNRVTHPFPAGFIPVTEIVD